MRSGGATKRVSVVFAVSTIHSIGYSYSELSRIVLSAMDSEEDVVDVELDFEQLVSERRLVEWQEAARAVDLPMAEWVVVTLDRAAGVIRRAAPAG